jgi:hypothetical protein
MIPNSKPVLVAQRGGRLVIAPFALRFRVKVLLAPSAPLRSALHR